jgi:chromosome segregation ATPase
VKIENTDLHAQLTRSNADKKNLSLHKEDTAGRVEHSVRKFDQINRERARVQHELTVVGIELDKLSKQFKQLGNENVDLERFVTNLRQERTDL